MTALTRTRLQVPLRAWAISIGCVCRGEWPVDEIAGAAVAPANGSGSIPPGENGRTCVGGLRLRRCNTTQPPAMSMTWPCRAAHRLCSEHWRATRWLGILGVSSLCQHARDVLTPTLFSFPDVLLPTMDPPERLAAGDTGVCVFHRACFRLPLVAVCSSVHVSACRRMSLLCQFSGDQIGRSPFDVARGRAHNASSRGRGRGDGGPR